MTAAGARIAVAVATMDRPEALARCLDALRGGTVPPGELVVVDQGAEGLGEAVASAHGATAYVRQEPRGLSASRNRAIAATRLPVIAFTDDDCVPDGGWVERLDTVFGAPGAPDAVTGRVLPLGPPAADAYAVSSRTSTEARLYHGRVPPWLVGTGANMAVAREALQSVGGFDERIGAGTRGLAGEDVDLLNRLLRAGARIAYEPELVVHHQRATAARRRETRAAYGHGIGAACVLWARAGDAAAPLHLLRWVALRLRLGASGLRHRRLAAVGEEARVLAGTARGLLYGARVR